EGDHKLLGEPVPDLRPVRSAKGDHKLLNRATGEGNRFGEPLGETVPDLRPVRSAKGDHKLPKSSSLPEPYEGEILTYTPGDLDFSTVYAVVVSGTFPNPCGHALLFVPRAHAVSSNDGSYFQVAGAHTFPR